MVRPYLILFLFGAAVSIASLVNPQKGNTGQKAKGVPEQYAGNWVCQTSMPGYNLLPPNADLSRPATSRITTPPTVAVLKLSLKSDGSYEALNAKGHYAFDSETKSISWLDGPNQKTITKTELSKRKNGDPAMGFIFNKRYYGCYMPKSQRP